MPGAIPIFVDAQNRTLVTGLLENTIIQRFPTLRQGEAPTIQIEFLNPSSTPSLLAPFTVADFTGYTMKVGICAGSPTGGADTLLAYQDSWTLASGIWSALLDCNTVNMATALAAVASLECTIEIELTPPAGSPIKIFQGPVTCESAVIDNTSTTPGAAQTFISRAEAIAAFVKKVGDAGETITLTSPDGTKQGLLYWGDDGAFHAENIT